LNYGKFVQCLDNQHINGSNVVALRAVCALLPKKFSDIHVC
jgi:hypothetical protein